LKTKKIRQFGTNKLERNKIKMSKKIFYKSMTDL
jgi:hypothetical protein